jgi:hypothetical protein
LEEDKAAFVLWSSGAANKVSFGPGLAGLKDPGTQFLDVPGLGRAFKFTITIHDSKGLIKGGRTFTYVVYFGS